MESYTCRSVTVYCSSSDHVDQLYWDAARQMGQAIAESGYKLVFGGGKVGLMGALSSGARERGGVVQSVILGTFVDIGVADTEVSEMNVVQDMRARKLGLEELGDAFVALPGGFGTFEEITEMISFKQLGFHQKPIIFLNVNGYFDHLMRQFEVSLKEGFVAPKAQFLYEVAKTPREVINRLAQYEPSPLDAKYEWRLKSNERQR